MKTEVSHLLHAAAICLLASCTASVATPDEQNDPTSNDKSVVVVNQGGFEFQMHLPETLDSAQNTLINFNDATGMLEVSSGPSFSFHISRGKTDIEKIKRELSEDAFFRNIIVEEDDSSLLYQQVLPDGHSFFYHYVHILNFDDAPCYARTASTSEFTLQQVEQMKTTIQSITAL